MSALRQPDFSTEYYYPRPQPKQNHQSRKVSKRPLVKSTKVVKSGSFSQSNNLPQNLKVLSLLQKASSALALTSMTASIGLYISTVQVPKLWSQEYQNLEDLQLQERQLVSINETIKYQIAREAGRNDNLSISKPESALFINPAKIKARRESEISSAQEKIVNLKHSSLGY